MMRQRYTDEVRSAPSSAFTPHRARALFHEQVVLRSLRSLARRSPQAAEYAGKLLADGIPPDRSVRNAEDAYQTQRRPRVAHLEYALPLESAERFLHQLDRLMHAMDLHVHVPVEIRS